MTEAEFHVRSLLLGSVFADVATLGTGQARLTREVFRIGHPSAVQSAYDHLCARKSTRILGPGLRQVVERVLGGDSATLLGLIRDLAESDPPLVSVAPPAFPASVIRGRAIPDSGQTPLFSVEITDNHLHSGASISLPDLIQVLVQSDHGLDEVQTGTKAGASSRSDLYAIWATDGMGRAFCLPAVLGGVRAHLLHLLGKDVSLGKPESAQLLQRKRFWPQVGEVARNFGGNDALFQELTSKFDPCLDGTVSAILMSTLTRLSSGTQDEVDEFLGLLGALNLLECAVSSIQSEGLSRFVDRFDRMGLIRDLGAGDDRGRLVSTACENVFSSPSVVGAEFRKTVVSYGKSIAGLETSIAHSLDGHLEGFRRFAGESGRTFRAAMPIGFLREARKPENDPDRWVARYSLSSVSRLSSAILNASSSQAFSRFVTGVDTAGDESLIPNWPFLAAYQYMRAQGLPISFSIHAGESFFWPLQGVRRIGETLMAPGLVAGIGHCLALDEQVARLVSGDVWAPPPLIEVLADLSWLIGIGVEELAAQDLLSRVVTFAGLSAYQVTPDALPHSWERLHSLDGLCEIGMVDRESPFEMLDYADDWTVRSSPEESRIAWMMAYRSPSNDFLSRQLSGELSEAFRVLQERAVGEAREVVVAKMIERKVTVEACPSSNARLAGLPSIHYSHVANLHRMGLSVSISSDDPIIFDTNVTREYALVREAFGAEIANESAATSLRTCSAYEEQLGVSDFSLWLPPIHWS